MFNLSGHKSLIIGGNKGIGLSIASGLLKANATITITGRNKIDNEKSIKNLKKLSKKCNSFILNINNDTKWIEDFNKILNSNTESYDSIFLNYGILKFEDKYEIDTKYIDEILNTNLKSQYIISKIFSNDLIKKNKNGSIIYIGSLSAKSGLSISPIYASTKAAVVNLVRSQASLYGKNGIRVNSISPGWTETDLLNNLNKIKFLNNFKEKITNRTPLNRIANPTDIEGVSVFLVSKEAGYITGEDICIDGGFYTS